jgi:serine/threonine protein kinase
MAGHDESHTNVAPPHSFRKDATPLARGVVLAGRYQIEAPLGRGGAGVVLRAFDRELREAVAIKVLHAELAQEARWIERLAREVRLARQLRHPNVCRVFDFEKADGHAFIVMELAAGGSLRRELANQSSTPRTLLERLSDARAVTEGLAAIHESGVAHRDVTPQNILRMGDGRLVVSDFGLATEISQTTTSIQGGTVAYMAPEVVRGQRADFASDVWSLGVVIHEIVFGRRPTWSKPVGGAMLTPAPGRTLSANERLAYNVCRACTAEQPAARPRSAVEVAGSLHGRHLRRRAPTVRWLLVALAAAGSLAAALRTRTGPGASDQGVIVRPKGVAVDWTAKSTVHATIEGRVECLVSLGDGKTLRYVGGQPRAAEDLDLSTGRRWPSPLVPESWEHGCPDVSPDGRLIVYQGYVPDGRAFAFVSERTDGGDGRPVVPIADPSLLSEPKWLPDSNSFVLDVDYQHVGVFSLATRRTTVVPDLAGAPSMSNFRGTFGSTIVQMANRTSSQYTDLVGYRWPMLTEVLRLSIPDTAISVGSPDGNVLFVPSFEGAEQVLLRLDPTGRSVTRIAKLPGYMIAAPTFLPERMAFIARRTKSDAWRRTAGGSLEQLTHIGDAISIAPCGAGYVVTTETNDLVMLDDDGRESRRFNSAAAIASAVCSPDGRNRYLIALSPEPGIYRWGERGERELIANVVTPFIAISPDGKRLALAKASPAAFLVSWMSLADHQLHEIGISDSNCQISWSSDHTIWLSKRRGGRLLWVEVDVDTRTETGKAIEGAHTCASGFPDPQSPGNRDLRVETVTTSEIRSVPLSTLRDDAAR